MKKENQPVRSFGGIVSNDIKSFTSKEHMQSEKRHLRAYRQGSPYFTNGTKNELGQKIKYKVEENWN